MIAWKAYLLPYFFVLLRSHSAAQRLGQHYDINHLTTPRTGRSLVRSCCSGTRLYHVRNFHLEHHYFPRACRSTTFRSCRSSWFRSTSGTESSRAIWRSGVALHRPEPEPHTDWDAGARGRSHSGSAARCEFRVERRHRAAGPPRLRPLTCILAARRTRPGRRDGGSPMLSLTRMNSTGTDRRRVGFSARSRRGRGHVRSSITG